MRRAQRIQLDFVGQTFSDTGFYWSSGIRVHDFNSFGIQLKYTGAAATDGLIIGVSYNYYGAGDLTSTPPLTSNGEILMISPVSGVISLNGATTLLRENIKTTGEWVYIAYFNQAAGASSIQFQAASFIGKGYGIGKGNAY